MTKVEEVALALLNDDRVRNGYPPVSSLSHISDYDAGTYRSSARAAIKAMRVPTPEMVFEGEWPAEDDGSAACWSAMIDAALNIPASGPETLTEREDGEGR